MEIRSLIKNIFSKKQRENKQYNQLKMLNNYVPVFNIFGEDVYQSELARACIHAIAVHVAKTKAVHVSRYKNKKLEYLLTVKPNEYMSSFDMFYKFITQLYLHNNAYILIQKDENNNVAGFYPINSNNVKFVESKGFTFVQFTFLNSKKTVTVDYNDIIHLRRHFNKNDLFGDSNSPVLQALELVNTTNQGISNSIKTSNNLKGLIKIVGNLRPEDLKKAKDSFVAEYMNINNVGGVGALDSKMEYMPLKHEPKIVDDKQMEILEQKVFKYFNINKKIVMNDFDEEVWNGFYEGVIEPLTLQLSQELTAKIFTERERGFGNKIEFSANRLNYASNKTKTDIIKELVPYSILSVNEARELFNLPATEDGDKRIQTLNVVNAEKADKYQFEDEEGGDGVED